MDLTWAEIDYSCRFNASMMLERLRGRRMMFVGDSLNRGQYVSMVCLLHKLLPEDSKSMESFGSLTVFKAKVHIRTKSLIYISSVHFHSNSDMHLQSFFPGL